MGCGSRTMYPAILTFTADLPPVPTLRVYLCGCRPCPLRPFPCLQVISFRNTCTASFQDYTIVYLPDAKQPSFSMLTEDQFVRADKAQDLIRSTGSDLTRSVRCLSRYTRSTSALPLPLLFSKLDGGLSQVERISHQYCKPQLHVVLRTPCLLGVGVSSGEQSSV